MDRESASATPTVAVPAAKVFAVLADPTTHAAIDGTGRVRESVDRAPLTEVGQIGPEYLADSLHHLAGLVSGR
ncbi:hypothetical protein GCM10020221_03440 [Streptomyces thioluteus]|uniref:Uncharacterized protein n=1 Tax=Streptomyces thioluteus TaxID=66431 RepID=A0ABN3WF44_STRTU